MSDVDGKPVKESPLKVRRIAGIDIPAPPPGHGLDRSGMRLYDWITMALHADGLAVKSSPLIIVMLCHQIITWRSDYELCVKEGRYAKSEAGNNYELPHSCNERKGRKEIIETLPNAGLTVLAFVEAKYKQSRTLEKRGQEDLFWQDLVEAQQRGAAIPLPGRASKH